MNRTSTGYFLIFAAVLLFILTGCFASAQTIGSCTYRHMTSITSGNRTAHVLAVDLNRDGRPDIVGANHGGMSTAKGTISVALNKGKGDFAPIVLYTLGDAGPYETTAADFNGDGYLDLAVELFGTSDRTIIGEEIDVFINKGDGTFHPFVAYETGKKPRAVTAADLNMDGKQDLIVANSIVNTVGVLLGNGDGTFGVRSDYPAGHNPHGVVVADFNLDGKPDVAICNHGPTGAVNILMGKGDGTLVETVQFEAGNGTFSLDAGDLDGDGDADIVTANNYAASVSVLINSGNGKFEKPVNFPITGRSKGAPVAVTLGDLQGDGKLDVLCSVCNIRDESDGGVTDIFFGNGDGTLQPAIPVETGNGSYDTAIADVDGDGVMDIVSAVSTGSLVIMKGVCQSCIYSPIAEIKAGNRTAHVLALDLNKDGLFDIVGSNQGGSDNGTITVALGTSKGKFAAPINYTLGDVGPYETAAADFNGDGYPDLAVELFGTADRTVIGEEVDVFINNGDGTFKPFVPYTTGKKPRAVSAGDLNNDKNNDIVVANSHENSVGVLLGKGDGTFGPRIDYPAGGNPHGTVLADFNRDGNLDVAVCNNGPRGAVNVLLGKGDGSLHQTVEYNVGSGAFGLDAGDLNKDGYPDIVSASNRAASVSVLINTGKGIFKEAVDYPATPKPIDITIGDLHGDGNLDILSSSRQGTDILSGNGDGTFQPAVLVETGSSYDSKIADFDGDGVMDFASAVIAGHVVIMKGFCK